MGRGIVGEGVKEMGVGDGVGVGGEVGVGFGTFGWSLGKEI